MKYVLLSLDVADLLQQNTQLADTVMFESPPSSIGSPGSASGSDLDPPSPCAMDDPITLGK